MEESTYFTVRRFRYLYLKMHKKYPKSVETATIIASLYMIFELGKATGEFFYYLIH